MPRARRLARAVDQLAHGVEGGGPVVQQLHGVAAGNVRRRDAPQSAREGGPGARRRSSSLDEWASDPGASANDVR